MDPVGRTVAEQLSRFMGRPFIDENVSGGGGVIASQPVTRAAPDGVARKLNQEINKALAVPALRERIAGSVSAGEASIGRLRRAIAGGGLRMQAGFQSAKNSGHRPWM